MYRTAVLSVFVILTFLPNFDVYHSHCNGFAEAADGSCPFTANTGCQGNGVSVEDVLRVPKAPPQTVANHVDNNNNENGGCRFNPEFKAMSAHEFLGNRSLVLEVSRKMREVMMSESLFQTFNNAVDTVNKSRFHVDMFDVCRDAERKVLQEYGVDPDLMPGRVPYFAFIAPRYKTDFEIMKCFDFVGKGVSDLLQAEIQVGDRRPIVDVIALDTRNRVKLPSLQTSPNKPLVLIASSQS